MEISAIIHSIIRNATYHNYRPMLNQIFKKNDFQRNVFSDEEIEQMNGFKALKKQIEWMSGRVAVKALVRDKAAPDLSPDRITLAYRDKGAPYVEAFPGLPMSLSHSGNYTAAALSRDKGIALGIDIEKIGNVPDDGFMKTAFTRAEIRAMPMTGAEIFRHWTLKEAFLKYLGLGFNESLHAVEIIGDRVYHHGSPQDIRIHTRFLQDSYAVSLIWGPAPIRPMS